MNAAIKPTEPDQPGAHLRLVSDRAGGAASGITLSGVSKTYRSRDGDVPSLRPLDFHINEGEFFVVVGPSGCGKSTLLKMISGLLAPSTGEILVEGEQVEPERAVSVLRRVLGQQVNPAGLALHGFKPVQLQAHGGAGALRRGRQERPERDGDVARPRADADRRQGAAHGERRRRGDQ